MACPYFYPRESVVLPEEGAAYRFTLGLPHTGDCLAEAGAVHALPKDGAALTVCNRGYGRGACSRYPGDAPLDAIRFSIWERGPHRGEMQTILERDGSPVQPLPGSMDPQISAAISQQAAVFREWHSALA